MKRGFVDLHTHTLMSDGDLLPAELIQRCAAMGCRGLAVTDHVDSSNLDACLSGLIRFVEELGASWELRVLPGVELTHVPPSKIPSMVEKARAAGAKWVVVHGETLVEPVAPGTNRAAIEAGADLLAHPGLITSEDASDAAKQGVCLEISTRQGHSLSNGWVVQKARETGAPLLLNTDTHAPGDIIGSETRECIALGAGLNHQELRAVLENARQLLHRLEDPT